MLEISFFFVNLRCFVAKFVFLAIFAVLSHDRFLRFTRYYVEKNLAKNSAHGEKMTNMRYVKGFALYLVAECKRKSEDPAKRKHADNLWF